MERINTLRAPRFELDVDLAARWLNAVAAGTHLQDFDCPSAYDLTIGEAWTPAPLWSSTPQDPETQSAIRLTVEQLIRCAFELDVILGPAAVTMTVALATTDSHLPDDVVLLSAPDLWGDTVLVGQLPDFRDRLQSSVHAAMLLLTAAVDAGNQVLTNWVHGATVILGQLSNDPRLLERVGDSTEPLVRKVVLDNPATPEETRVLIALNEPPTIQ